MDNPFSVIRGRAFAAIEKGDGPPKALLRSTEREEVNDEPSKEVQWRNEGICLILKLGFEERRVSGESTAYSSLLLLPSPSQGTV